MRHESKLKFPLLVGTYLHTCMYLLPDRSCQRFSFRVIDLKFESWREKRWRLWSKKAFTSREKKIDKVLLAYAYKAEMMRQMGFENPI